MTDEIKGIKGSMEDIEEFMEFCYKKERERIFKELENFVLNKRSGCLEEWDIKHGDSWKELKSKVMRR